MPRLPCSCPTCRAARLRLRLLDAVAVGVRVAVGVGAVVWAASYWVAP